MHDRGAFRQVRPKMHPICVCDPNPLGNHVVNHAWEFVHPIHGNDASGPETAPCLLEIGDFTRAEICPHHAWQDGKNSVQIQLIGADEPMREQVKTQVGVRCIPWRLIEVHLCENNFQVDSSVGVVPAAGPPW